MKPLQTHADKQPVNVTLAYQVLQDPASSFWLKETVKRLLEKDIVDVRNELEILNRIFGK